MKPIKHWKASKRINGKGSPTNGDRAHVIEMTLPHYYEAKEGHTVAYDALDSCLIDLMSDLFHYAASQGIEPSSLVSSASINFESER